VIVVIYLNLGFYSGKIILLIQSNQNIFIKLDACLTLGRFGSAAMALFCWFFDKKEST
jgi:hypothetical protein